MASLVPVLLAGGVGSRLWPTSREIYPKQLLNLTGDGTLLELAARRALAVAPAEAVVTVTAEDQYFLVLDQLVNVDANLASHVVAEPEGRNTAAAVALAALYAQARFDDPILWVAPADHVIRHPERLAEAVGLARTVAERDLLVTFGIAPGGPDTGFGYIRRGSPLDGIDGAWRVGSFTEKPDATAAEDLIAGGDCYWNSGMFVFRAQAIIDEFARSAPEVLDAVRAAVDGAAPDATPYRVPAKAYGQVPPCRSTRR